MGETVARWQSVLAFAQSSTAVETLRACIDTGSIEAAAESLGISEPRLRARLHAIESEAGRRGWHPGVPLPEPIPTGMHVKRLSMQYGEREDGTMKRGGWVIVEPDKEAKLAALLDAVQTAIEPVCGCEDPIEPPAERVEDMLAVYVIGDLHLGMLAWADECGEPYDLRLCEQMIVPAMRRLIARSPRGCPALVINVGDFFHSDNPQNRTTRSGNVLDVDGRWAKVYATGVRVSKAIGACALEQHSDVEYWNLIGNHDDMSAITLSHAMAAFWDREPRMRVSLSSAQHRFREHGSVLIGGHHGHETKTSRLAGVMSTDQREAWGRTLFRHWYCGHVHHDRVREEPGTTIEYVRSPSPRDGWATGQGYRSDRDVRVDVWHSELGLRSRFFESTIPLASRRG